MRPKCASMTIAFCACARWRVGEASASFWMPSFLGRRLAPVRRPLCRIFPSQSDSASTRSRAARRRTLQPRLNAGTVSTSCAMNEMLRGVRSRCDGRTSTSDAPKQLAWERRREAGNARQLAGAFSSSARSATSCGGCIRPPCWRSRHSFNLARSQVALSQMLTTTVPMRPYETLSMAGETSRNHFTRRRARGIGAPRPR
mmetsp:Transcript_11667/g.23516  ORF Transcript_11667/g.23516 Transcript_11667/m.23516 type:complete len:200 (-) Transcript_11667:512-1111(-)